MKYPLLDEELGDLRTLAWKSRSIQLTLSLCSIHKPLAEVRGHLLLHANRRRVHRYPARSVSNLYRCAYQSPLPLPFERRFLGRSSRLGSHAARRTKENQIGHHACEAPTVVTLRCTHYAGHRHARTALQPLLTCLLQCLESHGGSHHDRSGASKGQVASF